MRPAASVVYTAAGNASSNSRKRRARSRSVTSTRLCKSISGSNSTPASSFSAVLLCASTIRSNAAVASSEVAHMRSARLEIPYGKPFLRPALRREATFPNFQPVAEEGPPGNARHCNRFQEIAAGDQCLSARFGWRALPLEKWADARDLRRFASVLADVGDRSRLRRDPGAGRGLAPFLSSLRKCRRPRAVAGMLEPCNDPDRVDVRDGAGGVLAAGPALVAADGGNRRGDAALVPGARRPVRRLDLLAHI